MPDQKPNQHLKTLAGRFFTFALVVGVGLVMLYPNLQEFAVVVAGTRTEARVVDSAVEVYEPDRGNAKLYLQFKYEFTTPSGYVWYRVVVKLPNRYAAALNNACGL